MEELDLIDLFYMIKKRLWLLMVMGILAAGSAYLYSNYVMVPQYATSAKLWLGKPADYNTGDTSNSAITAADIQMNQRLITTYAAIAKTEPILSKVKEALPFNTSVRYLKSIIRINLLNDTEIIQVYVSGTSPEAITEIANTFSVVFSKEIAEMMKIDNVRILEQARVPVAPYSPNKTRNIILGGGAGVALALFIVFLIEVFDHSIKIPEDVTRHLGLPILGTIPEHD